MRFRWIGPAAVLLAASAGGCSGGASENGEADGGLDAGRDAGGDDAGAEDAGECRGCLGDGGACLPGDRDEACGGGGGACVACGPGELCAEGMCVEERTCGPDNCNGCCNLDDECVDGNASGACGSGGIGCSTCPGGATCSDGRCVLPCADNCTGCCTADGECVEGTADATCGSGGQTCDDCGELGDWVCGELPGGSGGTCISRDCASTCPGCCSGDSCLGGDSGSGCGDGGSVCIDCGPSRVCMAGTCTVDGASRWDVIMLDGQVPATTEAGENWDSLRGFELPDPYVDALVTDGGTDITGSTTEEEDTTTAVWNEPVLEDVPARALDVLELDVRDADGFWTSQSIGECQHTTTDAEFSDTRIEIACGDGVTIAFKIRRH